MKDIYPLTIISDINYGINSGGNFVAFNLNHCDIPYIVGCGGLDEK